MAIIYLASASGAPGVTTTALGLAFAWPHPSLLLEADPTGSSTINAGLFRTYAPTECGLVALAMAHRHGDLTAQIPRAAISPPPGTTSADDVRILLGARSHSQAVNLASLWLPMTKSLQALGVGHGVDTIVDGGRLGMAGSAETLRREANLILLVTRTTLPALNAASGWATQIREEQESSGSDQQLGILTVGDSDPYSARSVASALGAPVLATIADDAAAADVLYSGKQPPKNWSKKSLARSYRAAVSAITSILTEQQQRLVAARFHAQPSGR